MTQVRAHSFPSLPSPREMRSRSPFLAAGLLALIALPAGSAAQATASLDGVVRDEVNGETVGEAVVSVVEHDVEVETDDDGTFRIADLPRGPATLRVTKDGYGTVVEQVEVTGETLGTFEVFLPRMENMLRELFVTGRRSQRLTGHSEYEVQVRGGDHHRTALDVLQGRVPGLFIGSSSGDLGKGAAIRLRGVGTIQGTNVPSVYLDGVRIDSGTGSSSVLGSGYALGVLQTIPADQVERVRVLSGPAATSRYQDGANGVIVIETVRGADDDQGSQGEEDEG